MIIVARISFLSYFHIFIYFFADDVVAQAQLHVAYWSKEKKVKSKKKDKRIGSASVLHFFYALISSLNLKGNNFIPSKFTIRLISSNQF